MTWERSWGCSSGCSQSKASSSRPAAAAAREAAMFTQSKVITEQCSNRDGWSVRSTGNELMMAPLAHRYIMQALVLRTNTSFLLIITSPLFSSFTYCSWALIMCSIISQITYCLNFHMKSSTKSTFWNAYLLHWLNIKLYILPNVLQSHYFYEINVLPEKKKKRKDKLAYEQLKLKTFIWKNHSVIINNKIKIFLKATIKLTWNKIKTTKVTVVEVPLSKSGWHNRNPLSNFFCRLLPFLLRTFYLHSLKGQSLSHWGFCNFRPNLNEFLIKKVILCFLFY